MKRVTYSCFLLLLAYPVCAQKDYVSRSPKVIQLFTNLESGLFDQRDLDMVTSSLKKASPIDRPWLAVGLSRYQRCLLGNPVAGLKILAPEVLNRDRAKQWLTSLKVAEKERMAEWREAKKEARRNQTVVPDKPTGLAVEFPSELPEVNALNAQVVVEIARCLMDLGRNEKALLLLDAHRDLFTGDTLVMSHECIGDLHIQMRIFDKSVKSFANGLDSLKSFKGSKDFSDWKDIVRERIESKLDRAIQLRESMKFGPGWMAIR